MSANAKSVTVVITCPIQLGKIEMARREVGSIIKTVVADEPACHSIHVHDDPKNPRRLLLIEYWDSEEAFTGPHMQTPHMQAFLTPRWISTLPTPPTTANSSRIIERIQLPIGLEQGLLNDVFAIQHRSGHA
jgi:quinol monooxygenase YgiN